MEFRKLKKPGDKGREEGNPFYCSLTSGWRWLRLRVSTQFGQHCSWSAPSPLPTPPPSLPPKYVESSQLRLWLLSEKFSQSNLLGKFHSCCAVLIIGYKSSDRRSLNNHNLWPTSRPPPGKWVEETEHIYNHNPLFSEHCLKKLCLSTTIVRRSSPLT